MKPLVPKDFAVPLRLEDSQFILRPLLITDVVKDYDAVMTSIEHLRGVFGPMSKEWPTSALTLEQDLVDLGWHQKEFQRRSSFAYTVMRPDETMCLGCAYIYPCSREAYDAEAYVWVRSSHARELDQPLFQAFKTWLKLSWPFENVAFPGRELTWPQWASMTQK